MSAAFIALVLILIVLLLAHAIDWFTKAGRAKVITRDSTIGIDQIREARIAQLQADQRARLELAKRRPDERTASEQYEASARDGHGRF